jgi:hypothetical protein
MSRLDKVFASRWVQFFEGSEARLSMTRLLCFLSFWPATYVVVVTKSVEALGWYLGAFVLGYVGGKAADVAAIRRGGQE